MHSFKVLLKSRPSSLQLTDVAGTVVALRRRIRRDKILVLAMSISYSSYLMLLTCRLVFDQSDHSTSKKYVYR